MRIYIDESGTFVGANNVSAVGALVIPDEKFLDFQRLYNRIRTHLPKDKGEVKGRLLREKDIRKVVDIAKRTNCLFEVVVFCGHAQSVIEIDIHKKNQAEHLTHHLTPQHHPSFVEHVWSLRRQLEETPAQLYVQSVAMAELTYNVLNYANVYYSFRTPKELGEYHWVIDAKDRDKRTSWETWWELMVTPATEAKTFAKPFIAPEGGDFSWHEPFRTNVSDYKKQFMSSPDTGETFTLKPIMGNDYQFSSIPEGGLEVADILVNAIRRSLKGNLNREAWIPIKDLMIHDNSGCCVKLISLSENHTAVPEHHLKVLKDFKVGGRSLAPQSY